MEQYKREFIEFMVESDVLKFGEFTLKSGRKSPFFMNAGAYVTGSQLKRLGEYYAKAIHSTYGDDFDVLFGPAYKGIPLGVVTAIAYSELYGKEVRYCSDRKEEKDHGADKGSFLGSELKDGDVIQYKLNPQDFGIEVIDDIRPLQVSNSEESYAIMKRVLSGEMGPCRDIVVLNAAAALYCADVASSMEEGIVLAVDAIDSGKALNKQQIFIEYTNQLS